jgi:hypothetical protein
MFWCFACEIRYIFMKLKVLSGECSKDQPIFTSRCSLPGWVFIRYRWSGYMILEAHIRMFFTMTEQPALKKVWFRSLWY